MCFLVSRPLSSSSEQLAELRELHARELSAGEEQRSAYASDMDAKIKECVGVFTPRSTDATACSLSEEWLASGCGLTRLRLVEARDHTQAELTSTVALLEAAQTDASATSASLAEAQSELASLHTEQEQLSSRLSQATTELESLQAKFAALEAEKAKLEGELAEGAEVAERSVLDMTGIRERVEELEAELVKVKAELEAEREGRKAGSAAWLAEKEVSTGV
jgi:DNA repair exonuclease SbcCD ATPase subunit